MDNCKYCADLSEWLLRLPSDEEVVGASCGRGEHVGFMLADAEANHPYASGFLILRAD